MAVTEKELEDFGRFAAQQVRAGEAQSLQELVSDWEKLRRWQEGNAISAEQSRQGLSRPLDLEEVLQRVQERITGGERNK